MRAADKEYFSRFALDPEIDEGLEELYGSNFCYDDETDPFDLDSNSDPQDLLLEDDSLFDN